MFQNGTKLTNRVLLTLIAVGSLIISIGIVSVDAQSKQKEEKKLIYVSFLTHQEAAFIWNIPEIPGRRWTRGPNFYATNAKNLIETWEKYGIKGEYATMGVALQQLAEEYPDTIEKIKRLKIPVTRYCGVGHQEPCPVGGNKSLSGMTLDEAIQAMWEYETRTLVPNWHFENGELVIGNPRAGEPITLEELPEYNLPKKKIWLYGGTLAIEVLLGVIPMDFFQARFKNLGRDEDCNTCPLTAIRRALGMGSYEVSYNSGSPIRVGLGADYLAANWPRDVELYAGGFVRGGYDYLLSHPDDFKIVWPDPAENQWKPENSALEFFRKTYGVNSYEEVLNMECPVEYIKKLMTEEEKDRMLRVINRQTVNKKKTEEDDFYHWETRMLKTEEAPDWRDYLMALFEERRDVPSYLQQHERVLLSETIAEAAKYLMLHWPDSNHDGDFGGPPDYVQSGREYLTLAEAFEAFAFALEYYAIKERLPEDITIKEILGPIDYPVYELKVEPKLDPEKVIGIRGWQPYELDKQYFPDPEIVARQGINPTSHRPFSVTANEVSVMQAAVDAARFIRKNGFVPGSIEIFLPLQERELREEERVSNVNDVKMCANAAELLYGMAQLFYKLYLDKFPAPVRMVSVKIIQDQICRYVVNSSPISYMGGRFQANWMNTGFIWRAWVPVWLLNASWTYKPTH